MANSSEISADQNIVISQYNNLRKDVLDVNLGHEHSGAVDDGKPITYAPSLNVGSGVSGAADGGVRFSGILYNTTVEGYGVLSKQSWGRMEYVNHLYEKTGCTLGTEYEGSASISFTNPYGAGKAHTFQLSALAEEYVEWVDRLHATGWGDDGIQLKFRFKSSGDGVTCKIYFFVHVFGSL